MINIQLYNDKIKDVCEMLCVKRLDLFGSALTDKFSPQSDIDILVNFDNNAQIDVFNNYFALKENLEKLFSKPVDLVIEKQFKNPYFKNSLGKTRKTIYER